MEVSSDPRFREFHHKGFLGGLQKPWSGGKDEVWIGQKVQENKRKW